VIFIALELDYIRRLTSGPVGDDQIVLRGDTLLSWTEVGPRAAALLALSALTLPGLAAKVFE